ncbi:MAG: sensor histidine kinase [Pseudonocardiaceae bacterium]|nr:MAG: sensor histidine kinase [Pseudonocardiaceae bacterium]
MPGRVRGRRVGGVSTDHAAAPVLERLRSVRGGQESLIRWLAVLAPVFLVLFVVAAWLAAPGLGVSGGALVVSIGTAVFVVAVLGRNATASSLGRAHVVWVGLIVAASVALMWVQPDGPGAAGVLLGGLCVARLLPARVGVPLLVVVFVGLEVFEGVTGRQFVTIAVLGALAAVYGMIFLAHRLSEANREAERLLAELRDREDVRARATALAERQRLAREMHDVLAHSLSGLVLQLEGARMLVADDPADPRLPEVIERAHHLCRNGLEEARRAIGTLRDDDLPGPERLGVLVDGFTRDNGVPCTLTVTGTPRELDTEARLAVYRVAQEALTNVVRHASPQRVEVVLAYDDGITRLTVCDGGESAPEPGTGGYGLTGMRERAELLGGTLAAGPTGDGFHVVLELPA